MAHIERCVNESLIASIKTDVLCVFLRPYTHLHSYITRITNRIELLCSFVLQAAPAHPNLDTTSVPTGRLLLPVAQLVAHLNGVCVVRIELPAAAGLGPISHHKWLLLRCLLVGQ